MKKTSKRPSPPRMRPEYDFSRGVRGKYVARLRGGSNIVLLDPDVAKAFDSAEAVNRALRAIITAFPSRPPRGAKRTG